MTPRVPLVEDASMNPRQKAVADAIASGPRGRVGELMRVWLHSPDMADLIQKVGGFLRVGTTLPGHIMEMVVLITARHWDCGYEWWAHEPQAIAKGLDPSIVEAIRTGKRPVFKEPAAEAAYDFTRSMLETHEASDEVVQRVVETLGPAGFVDVSILIGHYVHGAIVVKGAGLKPPPGKEPRFA